MTEATEHGTRPAPTRRPFGTARSPLPCPSVSELPLPPTGKSGWPWTEQTPACLSSMPDGRPWPCVSVVTPSFNQGRFLEETIRSVLLQGYPNLEYLVVDGGSSDDSLEIIKKYEPWLAYWASERDAGQSDAINKGWERAKGEVCTYLNSDDFYPPGAIASAVQHLAEREAVGIAYGSYTVVDDESTVLVPLVTPEQWTPDGFVNGLPAPSMFLRRVVLEEIGFMDASLHFAMDSDLCIRAALHGFRFERVAGAPLLCVREWDGAKSFDWSQAGLAEVWLTLDRLAASPKAPAAIRRRVNAIKAQACLWPAHQHLTRGDATTARRFLRQGVAAHRPIALSGNFLRLFVASLIGQEGRSLARSVRKVLRRTG